ncbi:excinuclease ABC subunit A [Idiomarina xiamenensis]|uniref:Excinuclease ATPase subunit n=1 Tax=Idiomarina xiamenensis 10-D-4 TaxID=740709 RepID=K2JJ31_9GAMM|nr:excinuclease ABC subunit A [Idiomarina xiamenensis]EKE83431.1 hypothetical protein A10D4_08417 [Idiomarina xiamenensis 10-D-4]
MKTLLSLLVIIAALIAASPVQARNDVLTFPLADVMTSDKAKEALFDVPLYFAGEEHPAVTSSMGEITTSRKTNAFGKSDREACEWVLLSALKVLQDNAQKKGYDAVINIKSNYQHNEFASATEFQCGAGFLMAGVALKGEPVKFAQ